MRNNIGLHEIFRGKGRERDKPAEKVPPSGPEPWAREKEGCYKLSLLRQLQNQITIGESKEEEDEEEN